LPALDVEVAQAGGRGGDAARRVVFVVGRKEVAEAVGGGFAQDWCAVGCDVEEGVALGRDRDAVQRLARTVALAVEERVVGVLEVEQFVRCLVGAEGAKPAGGVGERLEEPAKRSGHVGQLEAALDRRAEQVVLAGIYLNFALQPEAF
jgi:hypothetical protein